MIRQLPLQAIQRLPDTQPRAGINQELVVEYTEAIRQGTRFPPVTVFGNGSGYWLADGFHRTWALEAVGREKVEAEVHSGGLRDAILYSCSANTTHGSRRTNADKRRAVERLLLDPEWGQKSSRWVAEKASVDHVFVSKLRAELEAKVGSIGDRHQCQDGRSYPTKRRPAKRHKKPAGQPPINPPRGADKAYDRARDATFDLIRALEGIAKISVTPQQYDQLCLPQCRHLVDKHLPTALRWLKQLETEWRSHVPYIPNRASGADS